MADRKRRQVVRFSGEEAFAKAVSVPCPQPVGRWNPKPHGEVLEKLFSITSDRGFKPNLDALSVSFAHEGFARMFGTFPLDGLSREEHGYKIGFANSVDKTLSLRIFFGTEVFICANGMFVGEFSEARMHTKNLEVATVIEEVIDKCSDFADFEDTRLAALKKVRAENPEKMFFEAVERGALSRTHIFDAREAYYKALDRDRSVEIENPGSLWAFQNAVTAQWKRTRNPETVVARSAELKKMVDEKVWFPKF